MTARSRTSRIFDVFTTFFMLGFTSFGGPAAHLGYFNQTFIKQKKWADEAQYAQWVALSQIVPGPGSSQVGFALGYHRAGLAGGIAAFIGFTLPSFVIMVLLAQFGSHWQDNSLFANVIHSLKLLAVVIVADACISMWSSFCRRRVMATIAILSAGVLVVFSHHLASLLVLFSAALVGAFIPAGTTTQHALLPSVSIGRACFVLALLLFIASFAFDTGLIGLFADFYQAGALVFGGGHVVLPMLASVASDSINDNSLLVGYAAAQAVPGPMFTMASFLGASVTPHDSNPWLWAGIATLAIFSSGLLLMLSAQNAWQTLANHPRAHTIIQSLNASVVGILIAALYHPIATSSITNIWDIALVTAGFLWLKYQRPPILILITAAILTGLL